VFAAAAPFAALFVLAVAGVRLPGLAGLVTGDMGLYGVCWVLGMARQTGQLARLRWPVAVGCAAVLAVMALWLRQYPGDPMRLDALVWLHWHPAASSEVNHVPLAEGPWSAAFALLALRWQPRLGAIDRHRWLAWAVRAVNARAMTIYLWHKPMIAVALLALAALSPGWPHAVLVGLMLGVLLAAITLAVGWVEDLAGRRPARLLPAVPLPSAPVLADAGDGGPGSGRPRPPAHTRAGG
jgi:cytochrome bd-type quinol oxidase subunit 1